MYKGGAIVCAADKVDYFSYLHQGLRCLVCGEEIELRAGDKKNVILHIIRLLIRVQAVFLELQIIVKLGVILLLKGEVKDGNYSKKNFCI